MNCHQVTCDKLLSTNIAQPTMVLLARTKKWHNHSTQMSIYLNLSVVMGAYTKPLSLQRHFKYFASEIISYTKII
jgi:hypothetical protein